ncbi:condensation domain-containing protein [Streptomyces sp. NBC_00564]|uniref:condensation domain-containing protein n=1 Tax=Streptomyces sp. NBC_00564 TaxID=2903663 RepID=UPI00352DD968|nr:condensation domain-containing protein [Streptomyces sp. NBC_00564]
MSVGQEALWFLHALAPDSSAYNVCGALSLDFDVDVSALEAAALSVVSGNTMLNCLFRSTRAGLRRLPGAAAPYPSVFEARRLLGARSGDAVQAAVLEASRRPFRLEREAPVRISLLSADDGDVLVVTGHHIVLDNVSHLRLWRDLLTAYGHSTGARPALVVAGAPSEGGGQDAGADYARFVRLEQDFLRSPRGESARRHWHKVLRSVTSDPPLVGDLPRPNVYWFTGDQIETVVPAELMTRITALAGRTGTTSFTVLFAVFQLLLYSLTGERVRLIGYPVAVRPGARFRSATGHYVNTLPFPARVEADDSFADLLERTSAEVWSGLVHSKYSFALMSQLAQRPRQADRAGLVSVLCVLAEEDVAELTGEVLPTGHRVRVYPVAQQQGQFDLTLQVSKRGPATAVVLKYNTSLFTADAARTVADGYLGLLAAAAEDTLPDRLGDLASTLALS